MKFFWKGILFLSLTFPLWASPGCASADTRDARPLRQDLTVILQPQAHLLSGTSKITFDRGGQVSAWLAPAAQIVGVEADGGSIGYTFREGVLSFQLPAHPGEHAVTISYRATFYDAVAEHPTSSEDPTYGVSAAIAERGTFLGSGSGWYPSPRTVPARRGVTVFMPPGTEAVTSGHLVWRGTKDGMAGCRWEEEHPVGELSLSAGPYRISESRVGNVSLYSYLYPQNASLSGRYLEAAAKYVSLYSELFGPYPFEKFAVVENFFPTGYGLPSYTLLGSSVIRLPFIVNTSFPHEIAHSWWGNGIEPGQDGNWSEGLVTYLADYYLKEKRSAQEARDYRLQLLADFASLVRPERDFPLTRFTSRVDPPSRAIGYGKAAMLFHMIRTRIGDGAFFAGLRQITQQHMYGIATWRDFTAAFSRSGGEDLEPFVKQWLVRSGGPRLTLQGVTQAEKGNGRVVKGTVIQSAPPYQFVLPLEVQTDAGAVTAKVHLVGERTPFEIPVASPAKRLLLDPQVDVFRMLAPDEVPVTVNRIKGSQKVVGVVTRGCRAQRDTFALLMESLDHAGARLVDEAALDEATLRDHDVIFCGLPAARLVPPLPPAISLAADEVRVGKASYRGPADALFLVTEHPLTQGLVAAFFLPFSQDAATAALPKISHYGKYGYLVFSGGDNREKGTVPPPAHSTTVDFRAESGNAR